MITARPINVERALVDPRSVFKEPIEVLACADLDDAHKRQILECWRPNALKLQAADDEAMSGGEEPMLKRVLDAIRTLERRTDAPRAARETRGERVRPRRAKPSIGHGLGMGR
jgi:hypothetical protein